MISNFDFDFETKTENSVNYIKREILFSSISKTCLDGLVGKYKELFGNELLYTFILIFHFKFSNKYKTESELLEKHQKYIDSLTFISEDFKNCDLIQFDINKWKPIQTISLLRFHGILSFLENSSLSGKINRFNIVKNLMFEDLDINFNKLLLRGETGFAENALYVFDLKSIVYISDVLYDRKRNNIEINLSNIGLEDWSFSHEGGTTKKILNKHNFEFDTSLSYMVHVYVDFDVLTRTKLEFEGFNFDKSEENGDCRIWSRILIGERKFNLIVGKFEIHGCLRQKKFALKVNN